MFWGSPTGACLKWHTVSFPSGSARMNGANSRDTGPTAAPFPSYVPFKLVPSMS
jgi:hypothetical protein